jgi:hypothetical protein
MEKLFMKLLPGKVSLIALVVMVSSIGPRAWACSSCGCTLNSDWSSQGYAVSSGLRLDVRTDYYDQDQLRSGSHALSRDDLEIPNEQEVQVRTLNRNTVFGLDYSPSRVWGFHVELAYFNRSHSTIPEGETDISTSHSKGIGDVRLLVRYQGFESDLTWGVQFGVKLPTGSKDDAFVDGPAAGETLDRGLQLGTGTTDVLLGVYNFGNLGSHVGYFGQVMLQQPINENSGFKPGAGLNANFGIRSLHAKVVVPQLQLNVRLEARESGEQADRDNSGAQFVYLSPGATVQLSARLQAFGFLQLPVYQHVNGMQLEPGRFYSLGLHYSF